MAFKKSEFQTILFLLCYLIPTTEQKYARQCPDTWQKQDGYCFKFNNTEVNVSTAANYCKSQDYPYAMLIEPRNKDIVDALNIFLDDSIKASLLGNGISIL